jgi:hypothetical protein
MKILNVEVSVNQAIAFFIGILGAYLYWFQLLLLTQKEISIAKPQVVGLAFAVLISILSWARFVFTTTNTFK